MASLNLSLSDAQGCFQHPILSCKVCGTTFELWDLVLLHSTCNVPLLRGTLWWKCKFVLEHWKRHHSKSTGHLYWNIGNGTTAKAQGITAVVPWVILRPGNVWQGADGTISCRSDQEHRGKPLLYSVSALSSFTCITQNTGTTALRPIRRLFIPVLH